VIGENAVAEAEAEVDGAGTMNTGMDKGV